MFAKNKRSLRTLTVLLALTAVSAPPAVILLTRPALTQSQTTTTETPTAVPSGTIVKIDGSSSMKTINDALAEEFKAKYPNTNVEISYDGTDAALQDLADGKIDLAAIGRPLTEAEKAKGLVAKESLARHKIALIIGTENPFNGDLSIEQFAQIFRGEVADWSNVGGTAVAIRMIDRPESSDTRQAFNIYPEFQKAPLKAGANAVVASEDSTEAVIKELGKDGIGYAIYDQVKDNPNVKIITMGKVSPDNEAYPFSQPLYYIYKGEGTPAAQAFLGYVVSPESQETVVVTPTPIPTTTTATETSTDSGFKWWWLLPLLLLIPLLLWLLKDKETQTETTTETVIPPVVPPVRTVANRLILTPRNCRDAYVYWEIAEEVKDNFRRQGGRNLKLRLYDVTDVNIDNPHNVKEIDCDDWVQDQHIPIEVDNRDYLVELGYRTEDGGWLSIARSETVRVPACEPIDTIPVTTPTAVASSVTTPVTTPAAVASSVTAPGNASRIILTPRNGEDAYVYWELSEQQKAELRRIGGRDIRLRLYDTTNIDLDRQAANWMQEYDCYDRATDLHVAIPQKNRDYVAELGYIEGDRWVRIARSEPVKVHSTTSSFVDTARTSTTNLTGAISDRVGDATQTVSNRVEEFKQSDLADDISRRAGSVFAAGTAAAAGVGAAAQSWVERGRTYVSELTMERDCRIILVPRSSKDAYAYWEVSDNYKADARRQGGERLMLRVHDATNIDLDTQPPHNTQEYPCTNIEQDKHVPIPVSDRDYIAELGYYTNENRWIRIIRSFHVHVPADNTAL